MASYDIVAKVRADMSEFITGMKSGEIASSSFATKMGGMGNAIALGTAAAVAAAGVALYQIGANFDDALDSIRVSTGQTGDALGGLENSFRTVFASTPASMTEVSQVISALNVELGLTGAPLEKLSSQMLNLSRITDTDLKGNTEAVSKVLKNFGVSAEEQSGKLDLLFRASQTSGVSVSELASKMSGAGAVMRTVGMDFDASAAFIGVLAKAGVDVSDVIPSMTRALSTAAKSGKDAGAVFQETFDAIKNAPDQVSASSAALEVFGGKAGPKFATLIREGKLSYDEYMVAIQNGSDTINGVAADTDDFAESFRLMVNKIQLAVEPLASTVFSGLAQAMRLLTPVMTSVIGVVKSIVESFLSLPTPIKAILPVFASVVLAMKGLMQLKAIMVVLQASTGAALASMAGAAGSFVMTFTAAMGASTTAAVTMGAAVQAAFLPVTIGLAALFIGYTIITQSSRDSEKAQKEYKESLDATTGALTEQSKAITIDALSQGDLMDRMAEAGVTMNEITGFITDQNAERAKQGVVESSVRRVMEASAYGAELEAKTRGEQVKKLRELGGANNELLATMLAADTLTIDVIETLYDEADAYAEKQKELDAVTTATNRANGMTAKAAAAATDAANANKIQADSITKVMEAQRAALDPVFAAVKAQLDAQKATDEYNKAVAEGKATEADRLRLTVAQAEAAAAYRDAITNLDVAQLKGDTTGAKVLSGLAQLRAFGFEPTAEQVRLLTDAIQQNELKLIAMKEPAQAMTDVLQQMRQNGTEPTKASIDAYVENLRVMSAKLGPDDPMRANINETIRLLTDFGNLHPVATATIEFDTERFDNWQRNNPLLATLLKDEVAKRTSSVGVGVRTRATGGLVTQGTSYMIGERGPEMFIPQTPGSIISADRVASMSMANASGGGVTYVTNVSATVNLPAGANGREVVDAITKFERHNGKVFARA